MPVVDDRRLFEFLILEAAQAGLSWETILAKRERYRDVYEGFDPARVARFSPARRRRLLAEAGIVRHRAKIESSVANAAAFLKVQDEFGSFACYAWSFVEGAPIRNRPASMARVASRSPESDALARDLKRRGFSFVGTTILYAFMQAVGMVNDHLRGCPRGEACARAARGLRIPGAGSRAR